jgi:electron transfer flavoprotein beta subunit
MKILVAIKQVPERDAQVRVAADGRGIDEGDTAWTINEPDAYALEEALQLKERENNQADPAAKPAEVVVLCAGPERAASTIREALAKGADRAIHIVTAEEGAESLAARDTLGVAALLADAAKAESPDLILTGLQSDDLGAGQTGVVLAELLGVPHATLIMQVERTAAGVKVKRELEDGWFQHVEMPLPALLTIQSGGNRLRYATLMGIKKAKSKETKSVEASAATTAVAEIVKVYPPERVKRTEMLTGSADEIAAKIVEKLKFEVKVL